MSYMNQYVRGSSYEVLAKWMAYDVVPSGPTDQLACGLMLGPSQYAREPDIMSGGIGSPSRTSVLVNTSGPHSMSMVACAVGEGVLVSVAGVPRQPESRTAGPTSSTAMRGRRIATPFVV